MCCKIIKFLMLITLCTFITSCKDPVVVIDGGNATTSIESKTNVVNKFALICNLTKVDPSYYDGWKGDCPGTDVDANNFAKICTRLNIPSVKLENAQCTNSRIVKEWNNCISRVSTNGLFIFYYSGHGGQVYSNTEKDGLDETLCFWDGQMRDDDIWYLLNKLPKTSRVFMVTDCCNSGSNYQLPLTIKKISKKSRAVEPNMFHIGGCNDGESSYGSNRGGILTTYLYNTYDPKLTYEKWFSTIKNKMNGTGQTPTCAETGKSFKTNKIFE